jgi:hypothetical protein
VYAEETFSPVITVARSVSRRFDPVITAAKSVAEKLEALNDDGTALIFDRPVVKQSSANSVRTGSNKSSRKEEESVVKQSSANSVRTGSYKSSRKEEESVVKQSSSWIRMGSRKSSRKEEPAVKQSSAKSVGSNKSRKEESVVKQSSVNSVGTGNNKSSRKDESVVKQSRGELQKPQDDQRDDDELRLWSPMLASCGNFIYSCGGLRDCCGGGTELVEDSIFSHGSSLTEETEIASRAASTAVNDIFDEAKHEEKKSNIKEKFKRAKEKLSTKYGGKKFATKEKVKSAKGNKVKSAKEKIKSAKEKVSIKYEVKKSLTKEKVKSAKMMKKTKMFRRRAANTTADTTPSALQLIA